MASKTRILLIDDEKDFLELMSFWLKSKGYDTITVTNGREGIEIIKKNMPDIVFLDIFMPDLNGVETLREIRKFSDIPVIMLTVAELKNVKDAYSMNELNNLGVSGFFKKRDGFEDLIKLLEVTIRMRKNIKK